MLLCKTFFVHGAQEDSIGEPRKKPVPVEQERRQRRSATPTGHGDRRRGSNNNTILYPCKFKKTHAARSETPKKVSGEVSSSEETDQIECVEWVGVRPAIAFSGCRAFSVFSLGRALRVVCAGAYPPVPLHTRRDSSMHTQSSQDKGKAGKGGATQEGC